MFPLALLFAVASAAPLDPADYTSLGSLSATSDITVDTDALTMTGGYTGVLDNGIAVFAFDDIVMSGLTVTVTGSSPIAILSQGDIALLSTTIAASAQMSSAGPGGFDGSQFLGAGPGGGSDALLPDTAGGGGHGGAGGAGQFGSGGAAYGDPAVLLQGGSAGGGTYTLVSEGGGGGGAVEVGASGDLTLDALSSIEVNGGWGDTSGGGGAGGMILLHASSSTVFGTLSARGGLSGTGGGGGGGHVCASVPTSSANVDVAGGTGANPGSSGVECVGDADGDGVPWHLDCDDTDATRYPGATEVPGDGIDQSCNGLDADLSAADLVPGDLVVNEIMPNPSAVDDTMGEWFEVYNPTVFSMDLNGIEVHDAGADGFAITSSFVVAAGDYVVFGHNPDPLTNGGITLDYTYSRDDLILANGDDEVIVAYQGTVIDEVWYDDGAGWTVWIGTSMKLDDRFANAVDNDDDAWWCTSNAPISAFGDLGTPGLPNGSCDLDFDGDGDPESTDCDDSDPLMNDHDLDGDAWSSCFGDCDDFDASISPADNDGDGVSLCDGDCNDNDPTRFPGDFDGDGISACDGDCDDFDAGAYPGNTEIPDNGIDDDCVDGDAITDPTGTTPTGTATGTTGTATGATGTGTGATDGEGSGKGCGCDTSPTLPGAPVILLGLLAIRRRE